MSADGGLPKTFFIIHGRAQPEDESGSYGPVMQKVRQGVSALLVWDTESEARKFLESTFGDRAAHYEIHEVDEAFCREREEGFRKLGEELLIRRMGKNRPS